MPLRAPDYDIRLKRLTFRSWHRGCKETDLVLGHFCDARLASLSDNELDAFEELLEESDTDIWNWLSETLSPVDAKYAHILTLLRDFNQQRVSADRA